MNVLEWENLKKAGIRKSPFQKPFQMLQPFQARICPFHSPGCTLYNLLEDRWLKHRDAIQIVTKITDWFHLSEKGYTKSQDLFNQLLEIKGTHEIQEN